MLPRWYFIIITINVYHEPTTCDNFTNILPQTQKFASAAQSFQEPWVKECESNTSDLAEFVSILVEGFQEGPLLICPHKGHVIQD